MTEKPANGPRRPAAFTVPEQPARKTSAPPRAPARFDDAVVMTPDLDDPFIETTKDIAAISPPPEALPRRRGLTVGRIAFAALGLWTDQLIRDLFARNDWLGYTAMAAAGIAVLALLVLVMRELIGLHRLAAVQDLKRDAVHAIASPLPADARKVVGRLTGLLASRAQTARGRARLAETEGEIIDGNHLLDLAERELLAPLDREARALILGSAKRVSIVTAVSPRALVDIGYVIYESSRLIRAMAELYGGRPGSLGLLRLMRDVIAHLAVTGSIAVGDSVVQQVLGHGLASKLSARLGEGVINGLMTARIGIAAMDLCRPLPFRAVRRPGIGDVIGDLTPSGISGRRDEVK